MKVALALAGLDPTDSRFLDEAKTGSIPFIGNLASKIAGQEWLKTFQPMLRQRAG